MSDLTAIAADMTTLLKNWQQFIDQHLAWMSGSATEGPRGNGTYDLTDAAGNTVSVKSPARMQKDVDDILLSAQGAEANASASATAAANSAATAAWHEVQARAYRDEAQNAQSAAESAATLAASERQTVDSLKASVEASEANASASADAAAASETNAATYAAAADASKQAAQVAEANAAAYASAAATFDPANFYTKADIDQILTDLVSAAPATLDTLNELANALGNDPNFATTVTTMIAGKSDVGHSHAWTEITGKPATFTPSSHGHDWSDITGAPTTLAGYGITDAASASHTHNLLDYDDTRSVDIDPFSYDGVSLHIKSNSTDGLADGGTYHGVLNLTHWNDSTGGHAHQLGLTDNDNLWIRGYNVTSWGPWKRVLDEPYADGRYAQLTGATFSGRVTADSLETEAGASGGILFKGSATGHAGQYYDTSTDELRFWSKQDGVNYSPLKLRVYDGSTYKTVWHEGTLQPAGYEAGSATLGGSGRTSIKVNTTIPVGGYMPRVRLYLNAVSYTRPALIDLIWYYYNGAVYNPYATIQAVEGYESGIDVGVGVENGYFVIYVTTQSTYIYRVSAQLIPGSGSYTPPKSSHSGWTFEANAAQPSGYVAATVSRVLTDKSTIDADTVGGYAASSLAKWSGGTFTGDVTLQGSLTKSGQGSYLHHGSSSYSGGKITVSTSAPSGGTDGDIWLQI